MTHSPQILQTTAELLACAVVNMFPNAQLLGTACFDHTFAVQFDFPYPTDDQGVALIEERMRGISKDPAFTPKILEMMPKNAANMLRHHGQALLAEQIEQNPHPVMSVLQMGNLYFNQAPDSLVEDLRSLHFKIIKVEVQDQKAKFIGTAASSLPELKKVVKGIGFTKKGGFERVGVEMRLIERAGPYSLSPWSLAENGVILREILSSFWRFEHRSQGFRMVASPMIVKNKFLHSIEAFPEHESLEIEGEECSLLSALAPLHGAEYAKSPKNSARLAEINSLFTPMSQVEQRDFWHTPFFTSDQASIFCSENDLFHECISSLLFIDKTLRMLGFGYHWCFAANSRRFAGQRQRWMECAKAMRKALDQTGLPFVEDNVEREDGILLTAHMVDSHGRPWWGPSIKVDLKLVKKLGSKNPALESVLMIERHLFGSFERWIALLTEHYSGWFPLWLSPEQVRVLPYCHEDTGYAMEVATALQNGGIRARSDFGREPLAARIRLAEHARVPYVAIVGEKEQSEQVLTVRSSRRSEKAAKWHLDAFLEHLQREVVTREPGR